MGKKSHTPTLIRCLLGVRSESACGVGGCNDLPPSVLPGDALVRGMEEVLPLPDAALVSIRMWSTRGIV